MCVVSMSKCLHFNHFFINHFQDLNVQNFQIFRMKIKPSFRDPFRFCPPLLAIIPKYDVPINE